MIRFDEYWFDEETASSARPDRQLCPDGTHAGRITQVVVDNRDWAKGDANEHGACLVLTIDVGPDYRPLTDTLPCHWRSKVSAVCDAAGVPAPVKGEDWDETQLEGCVVTVDTQVSESKAGREFVKVVRWSAGRTEPRSTTRAKPARTQAARFMEEISDGDIPF